MRSHRALSMHHRHSPHLHFRVRVSELLDIIGAGGRAWRDRLVLTLSSTRWMSYGSVNCIQFSLTADAAPLVSCRRITFSSDSSRIDRNSLRGGSNSYAGIFPATFAFD